MSCKELNIRKGKRSSMEPNSRVSVKEGIWEESTGKQYEVCQNSQDHISQDAEFGQHEEHTRSCEILQHLQYGLLATRESNHTHSVCLGNGYYFREVDDLGFGETREASGLLHHWDVNCGGHGLESQRWVLFFFFKICGRVGDRHRREAESGHGWETVALLTCQGRF